MNEHIEGKAKRRLKMPTPLTTAWWLVMAVLTFIIISVNFMPNQVNVDEGDFANENIYYFGNSLTYISQERTAAARDLAAESVEPVYISDDMVIVDLHTQLDEVVSQLERIRLASGPSYDEKASSIAGILGCASDNSAIGYYLNLGSGTVDTLIHALKDKITKAYQGNITNDLVDDVKAEIHNSLAGLTSSESGQAWLALLADDLSYRPNKTLDQSATTAAVNAAVANVQPIQVTYNPGQLVVHQGEVVTAEVIEALTALGISSSASDWQMHLGLLMLVLLGYAVVWVYSCRVLTPDDRQRHSSGVLGILILLILVLGKILTMIDLDGELSGELMMGLLIPVPAFGLLAAALVNRRTAIFATMVVSVFIGVMCSGHMLYILGAMFGGLVGAAMVGSLSRRNRYILLAGCIALVYVVLNTAWCLIWGYGMSSVLAGVAVAIGNGIFSLICAIGALPILENVFGITTELHLLELANTNHPLLKRLMVEAPGTYNHCVLVANLAEAAAEDVGANGLLVRVGSYFHDIGKVKRPSHFIENQRPGDNPHDKMQPSLSTFVITSHTKEGAEMARQHKLPQEIIDIIEQHHGTSLLVNFYVKAKEQAETSDQINAEVREADFCYPGPKPQTKEAAIVMLADSCQAASQAMRDLTRGEMEGKIREIIKDKFNKGQLDESDLTFRDLELIARAFARVLGGVNHQRILYPGQQAKAEAKAEPKAEAKAEPKAEAKAETPAEETKAEVEAEKTEK